MKALILASLMIFSVVGAENCYSKVKGYCSRYVEGPPIMDCSSNFSGVHTVMFNLGDYVRQHLSHSFQHLLMSTNFGNYVKNREGLAALYRKLSDETWEDSIHLLKYITRRGGSMSFGELSYPEANKDLRSEEGVFNMNEIQSLSRALDLSKGLAETAHRIHGEVTKKFDKYHDADTINFLEERFVEKHTKQIRDLAGHINDLADLTKANDPSLSIFMFDEYLKSIY